MSYRRKFRLGRHSKLLWSTVKGDDVKGGVGDLDGYVRGIRSPIHPHVIATNQRQQFPNTEPSDF